MICPKHKTEMLDVGVKWKVRRCPACLEEYRAKLVKAKASFACRGGHNRKRQISFPPVVMAERWP